MTGALLLCEVEFEHLTQETRKFGQVSQIECFQPCPGTNVGRFHVKSKPRPIRVSYTNGDVTVDANEGWTLTHGTVEQAVRFLRQVLNLEALNGLLRKGG